MLEKKMHKLDTKMMMMAEQIKRNDSSYQKNFHDIYKKLDFMSKESTEMFGKLYNKITLTHTHTYTHTSMHTNTYPRTHVH